MRTAGRTFTQGIFLAFSFILVYPSTNPLYIEPEIPDKISTVVQQPQELRPVLACVVSEDRPGYPVRLKIPRINVDAEIENVGMTPEGAMGIPNSPLNVGWFYFGPRPGEKGSAVMAGHFNDSKGGAGVFANLNELEEGDKLFVKDNQGRTFTYEVTSSRKLALNADATEVYNSTDNKSHLNLITCEGAWNTVSQSYAKRLVVFTEQ